MEVTTSLYNHPARLLFSWCLMDLCTIGEVYLQFFSTPNFIQHQYKVIFKKVDDHFLLFVQGIKVRAAFEERENKRCKLKKIESYLSFAIKLHYAVSINRNVSWQYLQI